jgi:uncharacterized protein (TIGR02421 family)
VSSLAGVADLDRRASKAARRVRILGTLSWPATVEEQFLEAWHAGRPELPVPPQVQVDDRADEELKAVRAACDPGDPAQAFVARTADSYRQALAMLHAAGTDAFVAHARALYGAPDEPAVPGGRPVLHEAEQLLSAGEALDLPSQVPTVPAEEARQRLHDAAAPHFLDPLPVELDPDLGSLAAAGARRVRLRDGIAYAPNQIDQLLQHEALVHSATKRNGQRSGLQCLGLSSPRTTADQEGLATLAELVTDTLDLQRLRRIALRVRMVAAALDGADFLDVFRALREAGQPEREAFRSSMRIFRGGDVRGRIVFTKDVVYLAGLRRVHSFLLAALRAHRHELVTVLFGGRMTCGDAVLLAELWADGTLQAPAVVPPWARQLDRLAAYLVWAAYGQGVAATPLAAFD